jgi:hypothetical protein
MADGGRASSPGMGDLMVEIDEKRRVTAVERFTSLAGLSEEQADALVDSAIQASVDQVLETIAGSGPVASSVIALRAELARFVCETAKRIIDQREVEVLFRATPTSAKAILTTMRATYEEALREEFVEHMRLDAAVRAAGTENTGLTWRVTFSEAATFDIARSELHRLGLDSSLVDESPSRRSIELLRSSPAHSNKDPVDLMGIGKPS